MQNLSIKPQMRDIHELHTAGFDGHRDISIYYLFKFFYNEQDCSIEGELR